MVGAVTGRSPGGICEEKMDRGCLKYRLTEEERAQFESEGYLVVRDALPSEKVEGLINAVDSLSEDYRARHSLRPSDYLNIFNFIGTDDCFLELLDWPATFPKVWGILGWNIQLYHSHLIVTPPQTTFDDGVSRAGNWHQDSGRLNVELEGDPRPRVSLKIGYFLTDTTEPNCGNFSVVMGSHHRNELEAPAVSGEDPKGAVQIRVRAGTAVFFDRRIWHTGSANLSNRTRKVLFYGYSYRWLRPRDDMTVDHLMDRCDPVSRQLLGASSGGFGYTSPREEDVPLRDWIRKHAGRQADAG